MSKRSFLRKSAVSLAATLGVGALGSAVVAQDIVLPPNLTIGTRNIEGTGVLRGAYYDDTANPPQASFDSVAGIRAYEAAQITAGNPNQQIDLNVELNFDQANGNNPPFFPFGTNDTLASVWSGEIVVDPSAAGVYRFDAASDDGTVGFIDGAYIVRNNAYQGRTRRDFTVNLTPGPHTIVMGWYEGGSGANGTFWLYPQGTGEKILNPAAPPPGITFRKTSYTSESKYDNRNVIVNADAKIEVIQDAPVPFANLTVANNATLTVDALADVSFTKSSVGATSTFAVNSGRVTTGAITGGPITTFRKTGGGTLVATDSSAPSAFTGTSTLEVSGGTFVGKSRTGAGAPTAIPSSIGDAKILLNGGTFVGSPSDGYEIPGTAGRVGVSFFNFPPDQKMIGPIGGEGGIDVAPLGLLTRNDGKTVDYTGALAFDDDNPDFGHPNFNATSGNFVGVDNLAVLGYGMATFTNSPDPFIGDTYTIGTWSDDGVTFWLDLDNNGKFETMNSKGANELIHEENTDHAPQVDITNTTIPAGTYRFAAGFYEKGGNAVMDFRIARGTAAAANYDELKAGFEQIGPSSKIMTGMSSLLRTSNNDFSANPITVSGNSGLRGEGASVTYGDVTLTNGSTLTVGGAMKINNTIVDGTAQMNFDNVIDFGKLAPATAGGSFVFVKGGNATLDLRSTATSYNNLDSKATIGVAAGRLEAAGALATPATPSSLGSAGIRLAGGTFVAHGVFGGITDAVGAADTLTEYVYAIGGNQAPLIDNIMSVNGLFNRPPSQTLTLNGPIGGAGSEYNDAFIQTRWGIQDNVVSMWYGEMTFTDGGLGNEYTFASKTDDGSVWWIDLDQNGKFELTNSKGANEQVLANSFYQGPTAASGRERVGGSSSTMVPAGTYRVALGFYEGGGGALADFKFGRGNVPITGPDAATRNAIYDDPLNFMVQVNPTDKSIASFRARTYQTVDLAGPSFSTNAVSVTADTTIESVGASAFGPMTFLNTATVNTILNGTSFASATVDSGVGTIRNSVGNNRVSVGDAGAAAGATLTFSGAEQKITGSLTGAGTVRVAETAVEFSKNGAAATGTPKLDIGGGATMRFNPGAAGTFGAAAVTNVLNLGTLEATTGTVDLSTAVVNTPAVVAGLLGGRVTGGTNATDIPTVQGIDTRLTRAQTTDVGVFGGNVGTWVYRGEVKIPDTDGDGTPGPVAFGEQFDDFTLLKIDGATLINNNAWNIPGSSGAIEMADTEPDGQGTAGDGWFTFEARFGDSGGGVGPSSGWNIGFGIDTDPANGFDPASANDPPAPPATASQYVEALDDGSMNLFRVAPAPNMGQVRVLSGATLRVGSVVGANVVDIAADSRLQLNGPTTSKIQASALTIAGTPAAPTGTLDVGDSGIALDYPEGGPSPAADVRTRIIAGRGAPGLIGTWDGKGITSSASAAAPDSTSVGYAVNGDMPLGAVTEFRGQPVDPTTVLIRHTRIGDANLDGVVNDDDVTIVGAVYAPGVPNANWANGDFDYNGFVDDDDVTLLGALYNPGLPPIPAPEAGSGVAAVPEPSTWLMLTLGGLGAGLFGWRRRRQA